MPRCIFIVRAFKFIVIKFLLLFLTTSPTSAQYQTFDSNFNYIASQLNVTDNDLAFTQAEALLNSAATNEQQVKALMLLATLNNDKGNYARAINNATIALQEAIVIADTNWLMRINGFLSSNYRHLYLFNKGKTHLLALKELMKAKDASPVAIGLTAQESSYYLIEEGKYLDAINELQQAKINLKHENNKALNDYYQSTNYFMLGNCFLKMKEYEQAKENFNQSISLSNDHNNTSTGLCLVGLAEIAMFENQYDQANEYLIKANKIAAHSKQYELELGITNLYAEYHHQLGADKEALKYRNKYMALTNDKLESIKVVNNQLESGLEPSHSMATNDSSNAWTAYSAQIIIILIISILLITFLFYFKKIRKNKTLLPETTVNEILNAASENRTDASLSTKKPSIHILQTEGKYPSPLIEKDTVHSNSTKATIDISKVTITKSKDAAPLSSTRNSISTDTVNNILAKLANFEATEGFMESGISLTNLATQFNTNTKYLSIIINDHKKTDFNNYINTLRINCIIDRLKKDPAYLDYKISYLASLAGFSSHSKFTAIFKQITGELPQSFIKDFKDQNA